MTTGLTDLIAVAHDDGAGSTILADALERAHEAAAQADTAWNSAEAAYRDGLLGDEKALAKLAAARTAAETQRDRTAALVARLESRHAGAEAAELEEARRTAYAEAVRRRDEAAELLRNEYPTLIEAGLGLLRAIAEADLAVEAANADLPAGVDKLAGPEQVARTIPGLPREIVSDTELDLWCPEDGSEPIAEEFQGRVVSQGGGKGYYSTGTGQHFFRRHRFRRISYRAAVPAVATDRLAIALSLPALRVGDPLGWQPQDWRTDSPRTVLTALDATAAGLAAPPEATTRPTQVEYLPVGTGSQPAAQLSPNVARSARMFPNVNGRFTPVDVERDPDAADAAA